MIDYSRLNALLTELSAASEDTKDLHADAVREYFAELFRVRAFLPLTMNYRCFRCGGDAHFGRCKVDPDPFIEWVEPIDTGSDPVFLRARASHIAKMRRRLEPRYESDERAIEDFMIVNFAYYVTEKNIHAIRGGGPETVENVEMTEAPPSPHADLMTLLRELYDATFAMGQANKYQSAKITRETADRIDALYRTLLTKDQS